MYLTDQTIPWHEIEQMWIARPDNRSYHAFLDIEKVMGEEMRWEVVTHQNTYTFNPEHPIHNGIFITQKVIEALENMELGPRMGQARDLLAKIRESPHTSQGTSDPESTTLRRSSTPAWEAARKAYHDVQPSAHV